MRKRARHILIVKLDDLDHATLSGTLLADGFTHVCEARNIAETILAARKAPLDLILVDQTLGAIPAQQSLNQLRKAVRCEQPPVVLLADQVDVKTSLMAKAAGIAHVQRHPIDYEGELRPMLYELLRIQRS
jgi:CheY-like chemotaxis protein